MNFMQVPKNVFITDRLYNDSMILYRLTSETKKESGGFLIIGSHGHLGVVSVMEGEGREIVLEPEEELFENEKYVGTFHVHPITKYPSTGDVTSFLGDEYEYVMMVVGEDGSINVCIKTPDTLLGDFGEELEEYEQEQMKEIASEYKFLFYRGNSTTLELQNTVEEYEVVDETWGIERLLEELGIEGLPMYPEEYSVKK